MKPRVSVLVATYNHESFIDDCLRSILAQEINDYYEILIVDDASTDKTTEIVQSYVDQYGNQLKLFSNAENQLSKGEIPFKNVVDHVKGEYLAFCDGDDYWIDKNKLKKQISLLDMNSSVGLVHTDYFLRDAENCSEQLITRTLREIEKAATSREGKHLVKGNNIKHSTVMLRRSSLDMNFVIGAKKIHALDWIIYSSVASTSKMYFLHDKTVVYRIHKGGIWSGAERKEMERMKDEVRQYCARNLPKGKLRNLYRKRVLYDMLRFRIKASRYFRLVRPILREIRLVGSFIFSRGIK